MAAKPAPRGPAPKPVIMRPPAKRPPTAAMPVIAARPGPPPRAWPAPGRFPLPACPPLLEAIPDGIQACRCAPNGIGQGAVLGTGPYAGGAATCRAGIHAGAIGPRGGDLVIRVLPLPGEAPGGPRHGITAQPGRLDGRAYAVLPGLPGQLDWARRLAQALATPSLAPPGQATALAPLPLPQAADLGGVLDPSAERGRPSLGGLAPPVLMPALWRSPTRPADAGAPPAEAPPLPSGALLPAPAPPIPVGGAAQVLGPVRLMVAGVALDLADVAPGGAMPEGAEPRLLGAFLAKHGGTAQCEPVAGTCGFAASRPTASTSPRRPSTMGWPG